MKKRVRIAVYGSLRKGLHNSHYLKNSEYKGTFYSLPEYTLHSLTSYPGLKLNGNTSVKFEVYLVTSETLKAIDELEGVDHEYYVKQSVKTPYGTCCIYVFNPPAHTYPIVECGDWKEHVINNRLINN